MKPNPLQRLTARILTEAYGSPHGTRTAWAARRFFVLCTPQSHHVWRINRLGIPVQHIGGTS